MDASRGQYCKKSDKYSIAYMLMIVAIGLTSYTVLMHNMRYALWPHTYILWLWYGIQFTFVPTLGYVAQGNDFVITASCMGAKLFISAFLLLSIGFPPVPASFNRKLIILIRYYLGSMLGALLLSILRIVTSIQFLGFRHAQLIHNVLSLFVYFGSIIALYIVGEAASKKKTQNKKGDRR